MEQQFDKFGVPETPYIILCNPDKSELYSLGLAYDTKITKRFNAISEFTFTFPKSIDGGQTNLTAYDYIQSKRLILIENYGYFQIIDPDEDLDGATPLKKAKCQSLEIELVSKRVTAYGGTKPLWNPLDSTDTVLGDMIELAPNWSIGHVDSGFIGVYRTFNVSDTNVYNFLTNDVSKAFEAVFIFDTFTRTINVYELSNATTQTDIFLSFDNVISSAEFNEKSDEVTTVLSVYGGGVLNIRNVNPLGTDKIYNFSYYQNTSWMSQGLVDALESWDIVVDTQQPLYADGLTLLQTYNAELLVLQADLADLESEYLALEGVKAVRIQANEDLSSINSQLAAKQLEIDNQNTLISNKENQIADVTSDLQSITNLVSFETNFTPEQLLELNNFMFENTYKNENIIQTDSMNPVEIQTQAQSLYNQAQNVLSRISQSRYEFSLDAINYIDLQEFSVFTSQTEMGSEITVELENDIYITAVLLELEVQLDNPENFSMTFSNRLRLDNGSFMYSDLMGQVVKTGSAVSFDSLKWSNWENDYKDEVTTFITSSLNAAVNNLVSSDNQDILINQNGLRARQWNESTSSYDDKQMWMVNNMLAFSDDGFQTAKLALGEITLQGGGSAFGLVGEVVVGKLLAGNTLTIANGANNFVLDETGATLNNAKFSIQTINTKINIDPTATNVFSIQKNEGGTFNNKFWVDNSGNVNFSGTLSGANGSFSGTLTATAGSIGGLTINSQGIQKDNNNYIRSNGDLKWGSLSITGSTATFSGDIFANKLVGTVDWSQIVNAPLPTDRFNTGSGYSASGITTNSMSGSRVFGGTIAGSGMTISLTGTGVPTIQANNGITLGVAGAYSINVGNPIVQTSTFIGGNLQVTDNIYVSGGTGLTTSRSVSTPIGTRVMTFSHGVLVGFS
jgi:hypothetical protein